MKPRPLVFAVTAAFLVLATWLVLRPGPSSVPARDGRTASTTPPVTQTGEVIPSSVPATGGTGDAALAPVARGQGATPGATRASGTRAAPPTAGVASATGTPTRDSAAVEIGKVRRMIVDFHTLMGENPVGTNAEIMRALMSGNPHQATLGPPEGESLNDKGELVDPWGTPYFFHQLSRDRMEVRSAGPDKVMGTADDVVVK